MDNLKLWHQFLDSIKPDISPANFRTFFAKTPIETVVDDKVVFATPSAFVKETLKKRHLSLIQERLNQILGRAVKIELLVKNKEQKQVLEEGGFFQPKTAAPVFFNPKYTLQNFVVGPSNNVAYAAAQAVVQNPGLSYNPLFIYGGTGVGKTHLMIAIGNALHSKNSGSKVIYCSSEKFMNDYVNAIQERKMGGLRAKYRSVEVLLIDDIQFFSGREGTQEEFFHTFNELQAQNAQMVLTSDRTPHEIAKLEDRLKSRFAGGLMVDIQPPDFDTKIAILKAKCQERGEVLPDDTLKLLASSLDSNIRELEGKLMQILQLVKLKSLPPTVENIAPLIKESPKKNIKSEPKTVLHTVCDYFNLSLKDLTGPRRQKELVLPRHLAMYLLHEELQLTVEKIGELLGGRDHTTVMHGRDKIKNLTRDDRETQRVLIEIRQKLVENT